MSTHPVDGSAPASRDDVRRFETRMEARFQEVNARLVLHDGRFAAAGDRINQSERRADALSARVDSRFRATDRRFDALDVRLEVLDARIVEWRNEAAALMAENRAAMVKATVWGVASTVLINALLIGGTFLAVR